MAAYALAMRLVTHLDGSEHLTLQILNTVLSRDLRSQLPLCASTVSYSVAGS